MQGFLLDQTKGYLMPVQSHLQHSYNSVQKLWQRQ